MALGPRRIEVRIDALSALRKKRLFLTAKRLVAPHPLYIRLRGLSPARSVTGSIFLGNLSCSHTFLMRGLRSRRSTFAREHAHEAVVHS